MVAPTGAERSGAIGGAGSNRAGRPMVAPTGVRAYTGNRVKPGATGTGACFSYPFLSFGVSVMRGSMISGSTEYEFCRGDHWSPAFRRKNFCFSVCYPFRWELRSGRPMVATTGMVSVSLIRFCFSSFGYVRFDIFTFGGARICRGDQWSPALCNRNSRLAFFVLLTERNGRPSVARTGTGCSGKCHESFGGKRGEHFEKCSPRLCYSCFSAYAPASSNLSSGVSAR